MLTDADLSRLAAKVAEEVCRRRDEILTPAEAARMLGISRNALQKLRDAGRVPSHKRNGRVYYSRNELTDYYLEK